MDGIVTSVPISKTVKATICKTCIICEEGFEIQYDNDPRMICPICIKKLRKLIKEVPDE